MLVVSGCFGILLHKSVNFFQTTNSALRIVCFRNHYNFFHSPTFFVFSLGSHPISTTLLWSVICPSIGSIVVLLPANRGWILWQSRCSIEDNVWEIWEMHVCGRNTRKYFNCFRHQGRPRRISCHAWMNTIFVNCFHAYVATVGMWLTTSQKILLSNLC